MADRMIANDATNGITTDDGTSPSMNQLASSLSPIVQSRLEERAELQNLNNRFASYIESVRILEAENARLNATLESSKESYDRDKMAMKKLFDDKLAETRQSLKEMSSEKTKLAVEHTEALVNNDNLKCELGELRQRLQESQENLKNEIIARRDAENNVRQYRDDLTLRDQIHDEEMNETRRQMDASDMVSDMSEQYNVYLQESLQELRDHCGDQIRTNRNELKLLLDDAMRKERNCLRRENKSLSSALENSSNRNDLTLIRVGELEKLNAALSAQIPHLESTLEDEKTRGVQSTTELKALRQEMDSQLMKYQDLMDENVSLRVELAAFNKLLCNEEQCSKSEPGAKRYRMDIGLVKDRTVTSSSLGTVEIIEIDSAGKFVKLRNRSINEAVLLGGWKLIRHVDGNETIHEFGSTVKVDAGADLTVWSAGSGASVSSVNVVDAQKWTVGDQMKITLVNGSGKEEAKRIQKGRSRRCGENCQPNEEAAKKDQKCKVM